MEVDGFQPILNIETRTGLLDPREVSMTFSKITPSLFTIKEGSTFSPSPSFSESGDVAGDAIALPEFWYRQRSLCPKGLPMSVDAIELRLFVGWRIIVIYHHCNLDYFDISLKIDILFFCLIYPMIMREFTNSCNCILHLYRSINFFRFNYLNIASYKITFTKSYISMLDKL